jgi:predicted proteasome-type protease
MLIQSRRCEDRAILIMYSATTLTSHSTVCAVVERLTHVSRFRYLSNVRRRCDDVGKVNTTIREHVSRGKSSVPVSHRDMLYICNTFAMAGVP